MPDNKKAGNLEQFFEQVEDIKPEEIISYLDEKVREYEAKEGQTISEQRLKLQEEMQSLKHNSTLDGLMRSLQLQIAMHIPPDIYEAHDLSVKLLNDPENLKIYARLAKIAINHRWHDSGWEEFGRRLSKKAIENPENCLKVYSSLAQNFEERGQFDFAEAAYLDLIHVSNDLDAHLELLCFYNRTEQVEKKNHLFAELEQTINTPKEKIKLGQFCMQDRNLNNIWDDSNFEKAKQLFLEVKEVYKKHYGLSEEDTDSQYNALCQDLAEIYEREAETDKTKREQNRKFGREDEAPTYSFKVIK